MIPVTIIDGFLSDPQEQRQKALGLEFKDIDHQDVKYPGISICDDPTSQLKIGQYLGLTVCSQVSMFRRYYQGEKQPTFIHADSVMADISGILFLNRPDQCRGGLSFWKHKESGFFRHPETIKDAESFCTKMNKEGHDESKWKMIEFVPMKFNRLVLFDAACYHSRYPKEAFGDSLETARLIKVFFCTVKK